MHSRGRLSELLEAASGGKDATYQIQMLKADLCVGDMTPQGPCFLSQDEDMRRGKRRPVETRLRDSVKPIKETLQQIQQHLPTEFTRLSGVSSELERVIPVIG